ncbi:polyribonucleotide nucleotidyltransferase [Buchnera aphidicola]|uniref:Polyribonucleotide nucleotidyltransferase n=1 Tax=Buchnera aphidicola subsp. Cinara cedri (strain Cc) TaxID=372461 RepID=PNP_BUCCC|nr:polyribonucleotide nucleotidyltransferase [Buchnera aphidicola]Q057K3.1 RecName: Full=Polyribonucleotide nucleotidyltransferase; AltName: Full=Polynucleotide phosphorylase; Short=PNPase [Buchnera aphidicola BCc]ABJ90696.1 polyribonucleotide nucleotidyltransferase [Buchnera aphidicola BCc]
MLKPIIHKFKYGKHNIILETGVIARQATASVLASMDDTTVLITIVSDNTTIPGQKFFPLVVNYQERTYAAGRIPGGFFRREGRPSENEILISRLIDRPIRPLFPKDFLYEVQIIATVISVNPQINPDIISIIGSSAALCLSGLPFLGPIGAARIGFLNNKYILNPSIEKIKKSSLDLVVSGTKNTIFMVEAEASILSEDNILNAILFGHESQQSLIDNIYLFSDKANKIPNIYKNIYKPDKQIFNLISKKIKKDINKAYYILKKKERLKKLNDIKQKVTSELLNNDSQLTSSKIEESIYFLERNIVRKRILKGKLRIDGRINNEVRKIDVRTGILPRVHGSALFTRGETQALVSATLGTSRDAQNLDDLLGDRTDNFLFHYNFPPYSVGEIGIVGSPKRREIGHGKLAKRSFLAVMPNIEDFPYTIRLVSEITESNGSSSMASVCGASLALMDAGVPIKSAIAGIAMGLIKENDSYIILSDILGDEDYLGDMDFKVSGSRLGITALQMDIKVSGITSDIIRSALYQAKSARLKILDIMENTLQIPRSDISKFAPRIYTIKINPEKIKDVIGKGGSIIRMLTEETGTVIEIKDDGIVKISAINGEKAKYAIKRIQEITEDIQIGKIYSGKVTRILDFGAFVSIGFGKEGLIHISQISNKRIDKVINHLKINQIIFVKVLEVDRQGRIRLSMKNI